MAGTTDESPEVERVRAAFVSAYNQRDWGGLRSLLAADLVFVDHRPAGFGTIEGADSYVQTLRSTDEVTPDRRMVDEPNRVDLPTGVSRVRAHGTDEYGGALEWEWISIWCVRDGLLAHFEVFDPDALEAAVARVGELS